MTATAIVSGSLYYLGFQFEESGSIKDIEVAESLLDTVRHNSQRVTSIELKLSSLGVTKDAISPSHLTPPENLEEIILRLNALEDAIERINKEAISRGAHVVSSEERRERLLSAYNEARTGSSTNTEGEEFFNSAPESTDDSVDYSSDINFAFQNLESQFLLGDIYCKDTVCKITYSAKDEDYYGDDDGPSSSEKLIDELSTALGGRSLDIRFSKGESGDLQMYIEVL